MISQPTPSKFKRYTRQTIFLARQWQWMSAELQEAVQVVSHVLPFRTNQYVLDQLIDWDNIENDPIYRLTFPHRAMLPAEEYEQLRELVLFKRNDAATAALVRRIRERMNPHPAGQATHNVPRLDGVALRGLQHKYAETVQFFPSAAQACHAHCTYCSRWPQFVTMDAMKFQAHASSGLVAYLRAHPEVAEVLITGGDPLVMSAGALAECLEPLLAPELAHVKDIRIGTKSPAYWPQRFVTDPDADDLLRLFERAAASGKRLSLVAHYSHPVELRNAVAQQAVRRIVASGAELRMQGPLVRHVNDDPGAWAELWMTGAGLGGMPGHVFVERDTGPHDYFKVPLARADAVFRAARQMVPELAGTVSGPSMSTHAGRIGIDGTDTIDGERVFALRFLQARNRDWAGRRFFARFDPDAAWFDELVPAFGEQTYFFETTDAARPVAVNGRVIPIAPANQGAAIDRDGLPEGASASSPLQTAA